jgi:SlyX protein
MYRRGDGMSDERFIELETRLAHQDQALFELNEVVTRQQQAIDRLERLCAALAQRLENMGEALSAGAPADERPPHY